MKLYLSSVGIPNADAYLSLFAKGQTRSVAFIPTAWTADPPAKGAPYIAATRAQFKALGFRIDDIDLADYESNPQALYQKLRRYDAIWVLGGNTFWLNHHVHLSGFNSIIRQLLGEGIVYGGESAGSVIAGTTLRGVELVDSYKELLIPKIYWDGLNLVGFGIMPHYGSEPAAEQALHRMQRSSKVRPLRNNEYILVAK